MTRAKHKGQVIINFHWKLIQKKTLCTGTHCFTKTKCLDPLSLVFQRGKNNRIIMYQLQKESVSRQGVVSQFRQGSRGPFSRFGCNAGTRHQVAPSRARLRSAAATPGTGGHRTPPAPPAAAGQTSLLGTRKIRPAFFLIFSSQAAYSPYLGAGTTCNNVNKDSFIPSLPPKIMINAEKKCLMHFVPSCCF